LESGHLENQELDDNTYYNVELDITELDCELDGSGRVVFSLLYFEKIE
jgi:hypothetical protein